MNLENEEVNNTSTNKKKNTYKIRNLMDVLFFSLGAILLTVSALAMLGTFLPGIPYLGLSSLIVPAFIQWFWLLPLLGGILLWWKTKRVEIKWISSGIAALTIIGVVIITVSMLQTFKEHGTTVSVFSSSAPQQNPVKPDEVFQFASYDGQPLYTDIYKPTKSKKLAPIIVYIHGGAWVTGTRSISAEDFRWFTEKGWLVYSIDYTLSTDKKHYWDSVHDQIGCALTWVQAHATQHGGDINKLTLMGDSAGGNLAINVSSMANQNQLKSICGGTPPQVQAVAVQIPGVDPAGIAENDTPLIGPALKDNLSDYVGGTPQEYPERYQSIKSSTYLSNKTSPTLIFAALHDHLVNYQSIETYAMKLEKFGIQTEVVSIPYADHSTILIPDNIANRGYRQKTVEWLTELGLAPTS